MIFFAEKRRRRPASRCMELVMYGGCGLRLRSFRSTEVT
jgi:hypothetical protein